MIKHIVVEKLKVTSKVNPFYT
jgi:hypothetical protein